MGVKRLKILCIVVVLLAGSSLAAMAGQAKEDAESCVKAAKGPLTGKKEAQAAAMPAAPAMPMARVGKPAPDFEAIAYQNGKFKTMKLSDHKGKWVVLCFYPGDFTFV